ncbi:MAG TPA: magnesium-translocating P-type ATPase [Fibrobacteria bacterium]|nr:magnesium-translocating P-type ATPase [Fibrobacteria bacterium]
MEPIWTRTADALYRQLDTGAGGLSQAEAERRRKARRSVRPRDKKGSALGKLILSQFTSPITLLLISAAGLSLFLGDTVEGGLILAILCASGALQFWQERRAAITVEKLAGMLKIQACVLRDGGFVDVPVDAVVPGDVARLEAGSAVPGDALILESRDLYVDESPLSGESYPAEKHGGPVPAEAGPRERTGSLFLGTHVVSGTATALIASVGPDTLFGSLSAELAHRPPETAYESGFKKFGYLLLEIALAMALAIFAVNVGFHRPVLESLLFTLALTVGLTPQLLPAIQGITMSRGAARMADRQVIVRRLASIEDIGGMDVLCTDKTGTLTEGVTRLESAVDARGAESPRLRRFAYMNAVLHTGYANPIDDILRLSPPEGCGEFRKVDEVPYDFKRRRMSVLVETGGRRLLISKGAVDQILDACTLVASGPDAETGIGPELAAIRGRAESANRSGLRCLGVAYRELPDAARAEAAEEKGMVFLGTLCFSDPLKPGARESLAGLRDLGIKVKLVTGDSRHVAAKIARDAGVGNGAVLTGGMLRGMTARALSAAVERFDIFAEMDPNQKESVIVSLKKAGHSVGFLGDGINDAASLHAADVGISVDSAVDVTKQAADIVLLRKDLAVLAEGVREGRRAFANTLKYLFITTSANFGNMFSMAGASMFTSFLPMLPGQILLLNVLSDLPAMAIASDRADPEMVESPRRWNLREIQRFMLVFGLISSAFDFLTFGSLLCLRVSPGQFRTAWFLESVLSELLILLVIRTRRWAFRSRIGSGLAAATSAVACAALAVPYLPFAGRIGFEPLPFRLVSLVGLILGAYCLVSEIAKMPQARVTWGSR